MRCQTATSRVATPSCVPDEDFLMRFLGVRLGRRPGHAASRAQRSRGTSEPRASIATVRVLRRASLRVRRAGSRGMRTVPRSWRGPRLSPCSLSGTNDQISPASPPFKLNRVLAVRPPSGASHDGESVGVSARRHDQLHQGPHPTRPRSNCCTTSQPATSGEASMKSLAG